MKILKMSRAKMGIFGGKSEKNLRKNQRKSLRISWQKFRENKKSPIMRIFYFFEAEWKSELQ